MKKIIITAFLLIIGYAAFADAREEITRAISEGNCALLYDFLQNPAGKDKELLDNAQKTLARYTTTDMVAEKFRINKMDSRIRGVGQDLTQRLFDDPQQYLPLVITKMMAGVNDRFTKAKIIHDWICYNIAYDADIFFGRANNGQDYVSVIKNKKAVCAGYSELFRYMCSLASIEAIVISGYAKGYGYNGTLSSDDTHAWNAVKINNKWYLIDVTWDAGNLINNVYFRNNTTDYLFLDPRPFLYTHLPNDPQYQFYAPVLNREQFLKEPVVKGIFYRYGLELEGDIPLYQNVIDKMLIVKIKERKRYVRTAAQLRTLEHKDIKGGTNSNQTFTFVVPDNQNYEGNIYAAFEGEEIVWDKIAANIFEDKILPSLEKLIRSNVITEKDKEHFISAYYKLPGSGYYYYLDDQFAIERNNAVKLIHRLVNLSLRTMNNVLSFKVRKR